MRREHLDILVSPAAVHLMFDAEVGGADHVVEVRQVVLQRPTLDLAIVTIGSAVAVRLVPVVRLKELLALALQVFFEDDAVQAQGFTRRVRGRSV